MDVIFLLSGLIGGFLVGYFFAKKITSTGRIDSIEHEAILNQLTHVQQEAAKHKATEDSLRVQLVSLEKEKKEKDERLEKAIIEFSSLKAENELIKKQFNEKEEEYKAIREQFNKEFENLANKILDEKSKKFSDQNQESLKGLLDPLKERIKEFEGKVEKLNTDSISQNSALREQIEGLKQLNQDLGKEAKDLTSALKGEKKTQGNWGELQLENLLNYAGLEKDIHYSKETSVRNEEGDLQRLDFIIKLPEDKHLIIDSKVSLVAYEKYFSTETEEEKQIALKEHIASIKNHISSLSDKQYDSLTQFNQPDYILMFFAIEPALNLALREDSELFEFGLKKKIVLVSTSTLLATLKTISYIWNQDKISKNSEEIVRKAKAVYEKLCDFTEDLSKVGDRLNQAQKEYDGAINKLSLGRGNALKQLKDLQTLGIKSTKSISPKMAKNSQEDDENSFLEIEND
ncbi:MAG: DNA recombination protein RmuC [Flavobacteriales bacterium]